MIPTGAVAVTALRRCRSRPKLLTASVSEPDLRSQATCTAGMFWVRLADARGEELATSLPPSRGSHATRSGLGRASMRPRGRVDLRSEKERATQRWPEA